MVALLEAICRSFIQTLSPAEQEGCLHKVDANQIFTKITFTMCLPFSDLRLPR